MVILRLLNKRKQSVIASFILIFLMLIIPSLITYKEVETYYYAESENYVTFYEKNSLPTNAYKNQTSICYLDEDETQYLKTDKGQIVTKTSIAQDDHYNQAITFNSAYVYVNRPMNWQNASINIVIPICQQFQLYIWYKKWAGKIFSDKDRVIFSYNALKIMTLAGIHLNGSDWKFRIIMSFYEGLNDLSISNTYVNDNQIRELSKRALKTYRDPFESNELDFAETNENKLYSYYAILQAIRVANSIKGTSVLDKIPLLKVFDTIANNKFYESMFKASVNGKYKAKLTYHYFAINRTTNYYEFNREQ